MPTSYNHWELAVYCTAGCLNRSLEELEVEIKRFTHHLKLSKVYIENHRGDVSLSVERLRTLKVFFEERGIAASGGITPTLGDAYRPGYKRLFGGICYTDPASRDAFRRAVEDAASVFDEVILDDFFFTNCRCDDCLARKGDRSWEEFRLELMAEVSEELVMKPAKAVNPRVNMIIKYPNWNEAYQASGYNTEKQPLLFDSIYTGTETRDPAISQQHIPRYASFSLLRWMERLAPGRNGGAWFDNLDCTYIDYYLEQANLSVFGKAKELTLFCYSTLKNSVHVPALGYQLEKLDEFAGRLGQPVGLQVYEPHHAKGEDHLYDYLGMLGIPMELTPLFPGEDAQAGAGAAMTAPTVPPEAANTAQAELPAGAPAPANMEQAEPAPVPDEARAVPPAAAPAAANTDQASMFLTANAATEPGILDRVKAFLRQGGHAVMTSGFIEALQGQGIEDLTTLRPTGRKLAVKQFAIGTDSCTFHTFTLSAQPILMPIFDYSTNGTWQAIVALNGQNNIPLLAFDHYGKGTVHSLMIPDNAAELWTLPDAVVTELRRILTGRLLPWRLEGPGQAGWFPYDNGSFVVENFAPVPQTWTVRLGDGQSLQSIGGSSRVSRLAPAQYQIRLAPSAYGAFAVVPEDASL